MGNRLNPPCAAAVCSAECEQCDERNCIRGAGPDPDDADGELLAAARAGDYVQVRVAILGGAALERRWATHAAGRSLAEDERSLTPLGYAARGGHFKCVMALLRARASPNARDHRGRCPLHLAAASGNHEAGAVINCGYGDQWWPLEAPQGAAGGGGGGGSHAADGCRHLKCVIALLEARASLDAGDAGGRHPLHFAAASGNYEVGSTFVYARADPGVRDHSGRRAAAYLNAPTHWSIELWCDKFRCWLTLLQCSDKTEGGHRAAMLSGPWSSRMPQADGDQAVMPTRFTSASIPPLALGSKSDLAGDPLSKDVGPNPWHEEFADDEDSSDGGETTAAPSTNDHREEYDASKSTPASDVLVSPNDPTPKDFLNDTGRVPIHNLVPDAQQGEGIDTTAEHILVHEGVREQQSEGGTPNTVDSDGPPAPAPRSPDHQSFGSPALAGLGMDGVLYALPDSMADDDLHTSVAAGISMDEDYPAASMSDVHGAGVLEAVEDPYMAGKWDGRGAIGALGTMPQECRFTLLHGTGHGARGGPPHSEEDAAAGQAGGEMPGAPDARAPAAERRGTDDERSWDSSSETSGSST